MTAGRLSVIYLVSLVFFLTGCTPPPDRETPTPAVTEETPEPVEPEFPLTFERLPGTWKLLYGGNYGYDFRLRENYKAWVILYLQDSALVFKGIYTIEGNDRLRIDINEMKRTNSVHGISLYGDYSRANSSYFQFRGSFRGAGKKKILRLVPEKIIIDGNNSEGYFEPVIRLKRS